MSVSEKVAYLRGLMEGLDMDEDKKETKLFNAIIEALDDVASELSDMDEDMEELADYIEELDEDLGDVEEFVYDLDDDCDCCCDDDDCDSAAMMTASRLNVPLAVKQYASALTKSTMTAK